MKVRVRFSKQGFTKYVGHLDINRYFQKLHRRAGIDVAYTEGFSPHQKLAFAAPLSVGATSTGEYYDMQLNSLPDEDLVTLLNRHSIPEIQALTATLLDDDIKNAMASLEGADYRIYTDLFTQKDIDFFYEQESIEVLKKTKKSESITDIKPLIYRFEHTDYGIFMKVAQGSRANLNPKTVFEALCSNSGVDIPEYVHYERADMYFLKDGVLTSMEDAGEIISKLSE